DFVPRPARTHLRQPRASSGASFVQSEALQQEFRLVPGAVGLDVRHALRSGETTRGADLRVWRSSARAYDERRAGRPADLRGRPSQAVVAQTRRAGCGAQASLVNCADAQADRHRQRQDAERLSLRPERSGRPLFRSRVRTAAHARANAQARRVRRQVHDRLPPRISQELVCRRQAFATWPRQRVQFLRRQCQPAALRMETQRLDPSGRSARLVPVVLPLLHGPALAGRRPAADQALEGDPAPCPAGAEILRARRPAVPAPAAPGVAALGLRQPQDLTEFYSAATAGVRAGRRFHRPITASITTTARPAASTCQPGLMPASKSNIVPRTSSGDTRKAIARPTASPINVRTDTATASAIRLKVERSLVSCRQASTRYAISQRNRLAAKIGTVTSAFVCWK